MSRRRADEYAQRSFRTTGCSRAAGASVGAVATTAIIGIRCQQAPWVIAAATIAIAATSIAVATFAAATVAVASTAVATTLSTTLASATLARASGRACIAASTVIPLIPARAMGQ